MESFAPIVGMALIFIGSVMFFWGYSVDLQLVSPAFRQQWLPE